MAREEKRLILTRVGEREIAEETIITFPKGLIGFENHREFVLLPVGEDSPFLLLQSLDDPRLGFLVADPYPFLEGYQVVSPDPEAVKALTFPVRPAEPTKWLRLRGKLFEWAYTAWIWAWFRIADLQDLLSGRPD